MKQNRRQIAALSGGLPANPCILGQPAKRRLPYSSTYAPVHLSAPGRPTLLISRAFRYGSAPDLRARLPLLLPAATNPDDLSDSCQRHRERRHGGHEPLQVVRGIQSRPAHQSPRQPDADGHPDTVLPRARPDGGHEGQRAPGENVAVTEPDLFLIGGVGQPDVPARVPYPEADQTIEVERKLNAKLDAARASREVADEFFHAWMRGRGFVKKPKH